MPFDILVNPASSLWQFELASSKEDEAVLELVCTECDERMGAIEKDDSLAKLVETAQEHECPDED